MACVDAVREHQKNLVRAIFEAQGIDIDSDTKSTTLEDIRLRAMGLNDNDIATQGGALAESEGFGVGFGLEYEIEHVGS